MEEEEGAWVATLSESAAKLLVALLLRRGQWAGATEMSKASGISRASFYRAKEELGALAGVSRLVRQCLTPETPPVSHAAQVRRLPSRSEAEEYEDERAPGNYGGRRPKTAEDEAGMRRMEAIEQRILAKKGAITW